MKFSFGRALIIARREYLTTVRRKAFVFSLLLTPALMFLSVMLSKSGSDDARAHSRQSRIVALVDSSGAFANLPLRWDYLVPRGATFGPPKQGAAAPARPQVVPITARRFADQKAAIDSLDAGTVNTVLVVAVDFLQSGRIRRYEHDTRAVTATADDRALRVWLTRGLLSANADSSRIDRVVGLNGATELLVPGRDGSYQVKDDAREILAFALPLVLALLLGMAIVSGGQYLLQGVSEEKESRILESLLCTVTPDDLMVGKLIGLGSAGLTLVGVWLVFGAGAASASLSFLQFDFSPLLVVLAVLYFLFGYLFYASLMTGIGAITNNLREAQQLAVVFTMMNFIPFYALTKILNSPNSGVTVGMSLFPPTAPTTMMMRLAVNSVTGATVPVWQLAASLGLLAATSVLALMASSKLFRLGLLLYGKTPNLPEILRILRQK
jgi:ABC-2 type transport system permease protein